MKFRELAASAAAVIMSTAPAFAANEVSRAPTAMDGVSQAGGGTILLILAVLLIGLGVALAASNKSDKPSSP